MDLAKIIEQARDAAISRKLTPAQHFAVTDVLNDIAKLGGLVVEKKPTHYICKACKTKYIPKDAEDPTCPKCFTPFNVVLD